MNYTTIRRMLSFLLALCLVLGMIPSLGAAARAAESEQSPELSTLAEDDRIDSTAKLQAAIDNVAEGGEATFEDKGTVLLS